MRAVTTGTEVVSAKEDAIVAPRHDVFIILGLLGIIIHKMPRLIERRLLFWSGEGVRVVGA